MISGESKLSPFGATTHNPRGFAAKVIKRVGPLHPVLYVHFLHDISIPCPSIVKEILSLFPGNCGFSENYK